jgi:glycosyltransferase involved in cell wall biosynthesis
MSDRVIYIVRSWPRLSQTFVVNEVLALERRGVELAIYSLVRSHEPIVQPQVDDVRAPVRYLEHQLAEPWTRRARVHLSVLAADASRYLHALGYCLRNPALAAGYGESSTLGCFAHAVRIAAGVESMRAAGKNPVRVHAHFAHDPALVGLLVSRLTGLPFSFTGHARDLLQIPAESLAARAEAADTLVTCCQANADHIDSVVPDGRRPPVLVLHHGVDLTRFRPTPRDPAAPVPKLVSVGRLVHKKGYVDLLHALATVKESGAPFTCDIYGDGPLGGQLLALRSELGLAEQVRFMGARNSDRIRRALGEADAFVLTPQVMVDGDRDGIPNVLVEAMACGLPVVTTTAGGITELVRHGHNGLVCEAGDVPAIAAGVGRLLRDPGLRAALGAAARSTVEADYDVDVAAEAMERVLLLRTPPVLEASR